MKRNFPDFVSAWTDFARDQWCPEQFHVWMGISMISASIERKAWTYIGARQVFPNIYVLLVSNPAIGKSSAIAPGVELVSQLRYKDRAVNILADQTSEAAFYRQLAHRKTFFAEGRELRQCAGFLPISEASNSLKDMVGGGSIVGGLTHFYDCCPTWSKETMKDGRIELENVCVNMIAGCTFDHLKQMIPERSLNGGFASRILFVVADGVFRRSPVWASPQTSSETRKKLFEDLSQIHHLTGNFTADLEYQKHWEAQVYEIDQYRQGLKSLKMQALLARKHTNIEKLAMLFCVSEGNEMVLRKRHWDRARLTYENLEKKYEKVLTSSYDKDDMGNNYNIVIQFISQNPDCSLAEIRARLIELGMDPARAAGMIQQLAASKMIEVSSLGADMRYKLLVDANNYF